MNAILLLACAARAATFSGAWATTYGDMTLAESSAAVRGTYVMGREVCAIEGRREGDSLVFTYTEPDAAGEGVFTLAADGKSFAGRWRARGESAWNPWKGERPAAAAEPGFAGLWDTRFGRLRLRQDGARVAGLYSYGAGTLEGTVEGGVLRFRYKDSGAGEGEFRLAEGGRALAGRWQAKDEPGWKEWTGARVEPVSGRRWLYVVESRWEESVAEREYSYGEMLKVFFTRAPQVQVRQRFFHDRAGLVKWLREAAFLAEPVVVYVSSHGSPEGVSSDDGPIGAEPIASALEGADNVELLHFGACEVMKGTVAAELHARGARFPVSGFTEAVDWAASAITDFMYLDLILSRDFAPARAARSTGLLVPFATRKVKDAPFGEIGFRLAEPPLRTARGG